MERMFWLISLLILEVVLEGNLTRGLIAKPLPRKLLTLGAAALLIIVTISLLFVDWRIWGLAIPFTLYRLINLKRIYMHRLPEEQLRMVAFRAFCWLLGLQALVAGTAWLIDTNNFGNTAFDVIVCLQLLTALIILRASTHTWQHAVVAADAKPLADAELPSVSVLVPARNETDDLERCLGALVASDYPKLEIVVYDDCSANKRTPEIIRSFAHEGVRFIQGDAPDETRWLAKNYAYNRLSDTATGDVLLFCGVDAVLEPQTIRKLVCILQERGKDMLSIMPLRDAPDTQGHALLQAMRYYWEVCLPRGFFKRPPVLSTCWLIRRQALEHMGGFESVSRSVTPEAPLARRAVATDAYGFIRSDNSIGVYSGKSTMEQYATSVRVRYPQLHRRLELVAVCALLELILFIAPIVGLIFSFTFDHGFAYGLAWSVTTACLLITYAMVSVGPKLTNATYGWLLMPVAFAVDFAILHISMWKYEFSSVDWKGRNVCVPVMHLPAPLGDITPSD